MVNLFFALNSFAAQSMAHILLYSIYRHKIQISHCYLIQCHEICESEFHHLINSFLLLHLIGFVHFKLDSEFL